MITPPRCGIVIMKKEYTDISRVTAMDGIASIVKKNFLLAFSEKALL